MSTSDAAPGLRLVLGADRYGLWRSAEPKTALSIAGLDPSGGAGIIADLRTFDAHGIYGMAVATTLTVQSTRGMDGRFDVGPGVVERQVEAVFEDRRPAAVKIGAVGGVGMVTAVCRALRNAEYSGPVVVDPVLASSGGDPLLDPDALEAFMEFLVPRASVLTPNCAEVSVLCGFDVFEVDDLEAAALRLTSMGAEAVLVTGWKLVEKRRSFAADVFCEGRDIEVMKSPWIEGADVHGTGCVLSAAIAAGLAAGVELRASVVEARQFVRSAIQSAVIPGSGAAVANPYAILRTRAAGRTRGGRP